MNVIKVTIEVDHALGTQHPTYGMNYEVNMGFVQESMEDEFQDVYILGIEEPIETFKGEVIARVLRENGEEKWVAAPVGVRFAAEEIARKVAFLEQWFQSVVVLNDEE